MRIRRVVAALAVALVLPAATPAMAQAAVPTPLNVVALGDSYASGTGAGNYKPGTEGVCWRSNNSYSELTVRWWQSHGVQVNFTNATCSGATINDLRQNYNGQPPQLNALAANTKLVFLTIGGNDIGFGMYAAACLNGDCTGAPTALVLGRLLGMRENLVRLLKEINVRSPQARIVLVGYGRPMTFRPNAINPPADPICGDQVLTIEERQLAAGVSSSLDATLRWAAISARLKSVSVVYASPYVNSVQLASSFQGHSLCEAGVPFYRGFDALLPGQEGFDAVLHLNQLGHTALSQRVRSVAGVAG